MAGDGERMQHFKLSQEIADLKVIKSELETLRPNSRVYVKNDGGNIFYKANRAETCANYKKILAEKMKEKEHIENLLMEKL
ncbi:ASNSD1 upstream open reading frame protein [Nematostella vectensis]|uniref:ASNSD1 upstream open reading frame protein n=1 Tax=Nematostella vectensis TaxID=45351 RepID=UPI00207788B6|nr:ASNSD1 upstream open reading frame protein [Nematostella vectensis]